MLCPFCSVQVAEMWQPIIVVTNNKGHSLPKPQGVLAADLSEARTLDRKVSIEVEWMQCHSPKCQQLIVRVHEFRTVLELREFEPLGPGDPGGKRPVEKRHENYWYAVPRKPAPRPIDPAVTGEYKQDYLEASLILDDSPRMAGVLAGRLMEALLEDFGKYDGDMLNDKIKKFIEDKKNPRKLRENAHHVREMRNFGAHRKRDATGVVIDVDRDEVEWMLDVVDGLFEFYLIGPTHDEERRKAFDAKMTQTDPPRKAIEPLPPDEE